MNELKWTRRNGEWTTGEGWESYSLVKLGGWWHLKSADGTAACWKTMKEAKANAAKSIERSLEGRRIAHEERCRLAVY